MVFSGRHYGGYVNKHYVVRLRNPRQYVAPKWRISNKKINQVVAAAISRRSEKKSVTFANSAVPVDTTGYIDQLNNIAQGVDDDERIGKEVQFYSMRTRLHLYTNSGTGLDQMMRVLIVYDSFPNGVLPGITDVLDAVTIIAPRNQDNKHRFTILHDETFSMNASAVGIGNQKYRDFYNKIHTKTEYQASTASESDIVKGAYYIILIGNRIPGNTAGQATFNTTFKYTDN